MRKKLFSLLGCIGLLFVAGLATISCNSNNNFKNKKKIHLSSLVHDDKFLGIIEWWGNESLEYAIIRKFLYKYKQNTCLEKSDLRVFTFKGSNLLIIEATEFSKNFIGQVEMAYDSIHILPPLHDVVK